MLVCMDIFVYAYVLAYMVCAYVCKYTCVCSVHGCVPLCTSAYVCMHRYIHELFGRCACLCVDIYMYVNEYIHMLLDQVRQGYLLALLLLSG